MTAAFAPSPWPTPAPVASVRAWRFARELHTPGGLVLQWVLGRRPDAARRRSVEVVLAIALASALSGAYVWSRDAAWVPALAVLELLALAAVLHLLARHAADSETLTLSGGALQVALRCGRRVERVVFRAGRVRVEPLHDDASLVELSGQGQRVHVGRYVPAQERPALAQELRLALRSSPAA